GGALLGSSFTIVSPLVPLTVMVTSLATLTYLHSRYVDQPEGMPLEEHHVAALANKLLPVTASTVAAAIGFAALSVSRILPIREMGIWTATGLVLSWISAYTLFPALQRVFRAPTRKRVEVRSATFDRLARAIPAFSYRHRRALVATAIAGCLAGLVAVFGVPGVIGPISLRVDVLSNIDPDTKLHRDLEWFREHVMDLNVARVWIHLPGPTATDPEVLHAVDRLTSELDATPDVTGVSGPTTPLRLRSYFAGRGEPLPPAPEPFAEAVASPRAAVRRAARRRGAVPPCRRGPPRPDRREWPRRPPAHGALPHRRRQGLRRAGAADPGGVGAREDQHARARRRGASRRRRVA